MNKKILAKILAAAMVISSITLPEGARQVNAAETTQYREMLTNGDFSLTDEGTSGWAGIDSEDKALTKVEIDKYTLCNF